MISKSSRWTWLAANATAANVLAAIAISANVLAAPAAPLAVLSYAEQPVRLLRGTAVYTATRGTALQAGDMIESGAGSIQIDTAGAALLALGPQTRLHLGQRGGVQELTILGGWLKFAPRKESGGTTTVIAPGLQFAAAGSTAIVHIDATKNELFVEDGALTVEQTDRAGSRQGELRLNREQYAASQQQQPFKTGARPAKDFLAAMPRAFFNPVVALPPRAGTAAIPRKEREADYADVAAWLGAPAAVRKTLVARYRPRLADPAFRRELDAGFGQSPEWKNLLHPPASRPALPRPAAGAVPATSLRTSGNPGNGGNVSASNASAPSDANLFPTPSARQSGSRAVEEASPGQKPKPAAQAGAGRAY